MWDPKEFVSPYEGYIHSSWGKHYVKREGVRARNWEALEQEAMDAARSSSYERWSRDLHDLFPLPQSLAQKADFPIRPSEHRQYQQLLQTFDVWPDDYDLQGKLIVNIYTDNAQEQKDALDAMKDMDDISPKSTVGRVDAVAYPRLVSLLEYREAQQKGQDADREIPEKSPDAPDQHVPEKHEDTPNLDFDR